MIKLNKEQFKIVDLIGYKPMFLTGKNEEVILMVNLSIYSETEKKEILDLICKKQKMTGEEKWNYYYELLGIKEAEEQLDENIAKMYLSMIEYSQNNVDNKRILELIKSLNNHLKESAIKRLESKNKLINLFNNE